MHPFQRRSIRRFPKGTEFVPEIKEFEPLASLTDGAEDGKIRLVNGTVLSGIDEVCHPRLHLTLTMIHHARAGYSGDRI